MIYLGSMRIGPRGFAIVAALLLLVACAEEEPTARERRRPLEIMTEAPPVEPIPEGSEPSALIGPFRSLMSLDEVIALTGDLPFEVKMNQRLEQRGTCPGQQWIHLAITRFWDLDHKGTLTLGFYDDLLTWARFLTGDGEGYRTAFFARHQIERPSPGTPAFVLPGTLVRNPVTGNLGIMVEDFRATRWVNSVELACRYQWQKEQGWTDGDLAEADDS